MNKLIFVIAVLLSGSLMATDCCKSNSNKTDTACEQTDTAVSKDQSMMDKMDHEKGMKMNGSDVYYTCPMESHKHIRSDKPGNCPECGMTLIAVESKDRPMMNKMGNMEGMSGMKGMIMKGMKMQDMKEMKGMKGMKMDDDALYYTCPMESHKHIHSSEPGNCPECGMKMVAVEITTEAEAEFYGCPMESHSHVRSDKPGNCPECGMTLKPMRLKK